MSYEAELLRKLDYLKHQMQFEGHDSDILQLVYSLKRVIKEYFPMNAIPEDMMESIRLLEMRFQIASEQLSITSERFINHIQKNKIKIEIKP